MNTLFYTFYRTFTELKDGKIMPAYGTGMIKTGFRPSDDPNTHAYNIPGNAMFSTYLDLVAKNILLNIPTNSVFRGEAVRLALKMQSMSKTIRDAIFDFGVVKNKSGVKVFAYEVDGKG